MTGVGIAVVEFTTLVNQYVGYAVRNHHTTDRQVARRHTLGHRHQVGFEIQQVAAKPVAGAAETTNHFVYDEQDFVLSANFLHLAPVAVGRHNHATSALDRLGDERRNPVFAELFDLVGERLCNFTTEFIRVQVATQFAAFAEPVGLLDVDNIRNYSALLVHIGHSAEARSGDCAAMVSIFAADDDTLFWFAKNIPVTPDHAKRGIVGFRSGTGEKRVIHVRGSHFGE